MMELRPKLAEQLRRDSTNYAGFRAACALAAHNPGEYLTSTLRALQRFSRDKDVARIAKSYLKKLDK